MKLHILFFHKLIAYLLYFVTTRKFIMRRVQSMVCFLSLLKSWVGFLTTCLKHFIYKNSEASIITWLRHLWFTLFKSFLLKSTPLRKQCFDTKIISASLNPLKKNYFRILQSFHPFDLEFHKIWQELWTPEEEGFCIFCNF